MKERVGKNNITSKPGPGSENDSGIEEEGESDDANLEEIDDNEN